MGRAADREQRDHGAVVRQAVECARADHGDAVHQPRVDALLGGKTHIGAAERVERNRQSARCRTGERGEHIGRHRQRNQRTALDRQHPVAHHREGGQRGDDRAETDKAGDAQHRQGGRIGAGVHAGAQRGQTPIVDRDQRDDRGRERGHNRPHAPDRGQRCRAPRLFGEIRSIETRQYEQRHQEIDADHDRQRQNRQGDGRSRIALMPVADLRRIERAGGRCALAHDLIFRRTASAARPHPRHSLRPCGERTASARASHQRPNPSMMAEAMMPRPGAANGVVPKNGIGIAF